MSVNHLWSRSELARTLNVSPDTIDGWRRSGKVKAVRLPGGEHRFVLPDELVRELDALREGRG